MKLYELTYIISPKLVEEERKKLSERVVSHIEAQPTSQQAISSFLITLNFYTEPEKIQEIEKKLKEEQGIVRYMILKKVVSEAKHSKRMPRKPLIKPVKTEEKKVELKEIEKKLEEILDKEI